VLGQPSYMEHDDSGDDSGDVASAAWDKLASLMETHSPDDGDLLDLVPLEIRTALCEVASLQTIPARRFLEYSGVSITGPQGGNVPKSSLARLMATALSVPVVSAGKAKPSLHVPSAQVEATQAMPDTVASSIASMMVLLQDLSVRVKSVESGPQLSAGGGGFAPPVNAKLSSAEHAAIVAGAVGPDPKSDHAANMSHVFGVMGDAGYRADSNFASPGFVGELGGIQGQTLLQNPPLSVPFQHQFSLPQRAPSFPPFLSLTLGFNAHFVAGEKKGHTSSLSRKHALVGRGDEYLGFQNARDVYRMHGSYVAWGRTQRMTKHQNRREFQTLCVSLDQLMQSQSAEVGILDLFEVLVRRLMAVRMADQQGNWKHASTGESRMTANEVGHFPRHISALNRKDAVEEYEDCSSDDESEDGVLVVAAGSSKGMKSPKKGRRLQ
jgi:hypothetical protein